jgi:hypothetical protein
MGTWDAIKRICWLLFFAQAKTKSPAGEKGIYKA